jgi:hypothetical protein
VQRRELDGNDPLWPVFVTSRTDRTIDILFNLLERA